MSSCAGRGLVKDIAVAVLHSYTVNRLLANRLILRRGGNLRAIGRLLDGAKRVDEVVLVGHPVKADKMFIGLKMESLRVVLCIPDPRLST